MNVESLKNKVEKRVSIANRKSEFNEVGSYLKRKRKEMKITQDEIAKGICSISYLSKIENNQIVPKECYVKELFSRMNISEDVYHITVNDSLYLKNALDAFFHYDSVSLKELYDSIKTIENNIPISIIKYIYLVYFQDDNASKLQRELENLITNMEVLELKIYLLISAVHYANDSKHKKALKILAANKKLKLSNDRLESLIYYYEYISKQHIGLINCSSVDFYKYLNLASKYNNSFRKMNLVLLRLSYLAEENPKEVLKLLNEINRTSLEEEQLNYLYLIKGGIELHLGEVNNGKNTLFNISDSSIHDIPRKLLLYNVAMEAQNENDIEYYLSKIKIFTFNKSTLKYKVLFEVISSKTEEELKSYLKEIAVPYFIEVEDARNLRKYTHMLMHICSNNSRYKEATQHFKKYQKELTKLTNI